MKKFVLLSLSVLLAACPVACVEDPTTSESTCVDTSTEVDCSYVADTVTVTSTGTATVTSTSTGTAQ